MNKALLFAAVGAAAYYTRDKWLPQVETAWNEIPPASGSTGAAPGLPVIGTGNTTPINAHSPGAVPLGDQGCFLYPNGTNGAVIINCPPGVSPPATTTPNNCASGFTLDAAGICTRYPDAVLLAQLNTIAWTGTQDIPIEQINRIDPQILAMYSTTTGVNAGTVLAYMLGLGGTAPDGTMRPGSDGNIYKSLGGVFYRQGTATSNTVSGLGRLRSVANIAAALPITPATLIMASADPAIAAITGRDQRAMLTANQWNGFYTQATGIVQGISLSPREDPHALMSAEQYQARRKAAGLAVAPPRLGIIRTVRRGAFPLGGVRTGPPIGPAAIHTHDVLGRIGLINQWTPPGNRTIYSIPGRGAVPAGRGGKIPAPRNLGVITDGGGNHRSQRSPFPRPEWWRTA